MNKGMNKGVEKLIHTVDGKEKKNGGISKVLRGVHGAVKGPSFTYKL
jgi:hypothetical protein